jgi:hypothetical protein
VKVGDLVAYAWNAKERPEEVELAIVTDINPLGREGTTSDKYIQIYVLAVPEINPPLCVPRFKLDVINESR